MAVLQTSPDATSDDRCEAGLLARLKAGDESAYCEVIQTHAPRLLLVARCLLGNEEDARDAVQDSLLSAFRGIGKFDGNARLATWLHRITVNAALMKLRSRRRTPEQSIETLLPTYFDDGHRVDAQRRWAVFDTAVATHEVCELVRSSIGRLPESYRTVLLLRDIEERTTEETATLLEIEVGAVKTRLHRARQALRTLLDPYMCGGNR
jgi:RNA polymerase sigma-70 factor (ECF subfamily)